MFIKEVIVNWLSDSAIIEMAMSRHDVESKITSLSYPVTDHLIKILKWKDPINYRKHCLDINKWIYKIQSFKLKGSKPTQTDYFKWMFSDVSSDEITTDRFIQGLHEYHHLPVIHSDNEVFQYLKSIFYQVSYDLSLNQFNDIRDYLPKDENNT